MIEEHRIAATAGPRFQVNGAQVLHIERRDNVEAFGLHPAGVRRFLLGFEFVGEFVGNDGVFGHWALLIGIDRLATKLRTLPRKSRGVRGRRQCGYCSTFRPAALMIGHQVAISALRRASSASGVVWPISGISRPISTICLWNAGSAIASTAAALSLAMMSGGVPFGAHSAFHTDT